MEPQDHKTPTNSGHGGTHLCSKCGWPYPNIHPSARHRRAHRKVCGTVEGYKLDNIQDEKTHSDGDVERCVSRNDEHETPNEKVTERNISRRSNSGVGSISIKSTRSEDDVYTDADMDFVHGSGLDASDGVVGRQKSMQKIALDPDSTKVAIENAITDKSFAPVAHVEKSQVQTVQKLEAENDKMEGAMLSQDCTSCLTNDSTSVSATVTTENESAVEHVMQGSRTSSEINLNLYVGEGEETSRKDLSVVAANISDGISPLIDVSEQLLDCVSGDRIVKPAEVETDAFKAKIESSCELDSDLNDSAQVTNRVNGNLGTYTCKIEEPDSKVTIEDVRVVAIPHAVPLEEHPEIVVEDLDHKEEKFSMPMAPNSTQGFEHITNRKDLGLEESCYCTELAKTSESAGVSSQGDVFDGSHSTDNVLKQDLEQNQCEVNQNIVGDTNQLSDPIASDIQACDTDIGEFKGKLLKDIETESLKKEVSRSEDQQKRSLPLDDVSVEAVGIILDGGDDQSAILEEENLIVLEINSSPTQAKEVINACDSNDIGDSEKMIGGENESKARTTETEPCYELSLPGSHEENVEVPKIDNCESLLILDSSNVIVGVSQPESLRASEGIGETQNTGGHIAESKNHLDSPSEVTQREAGHEDIRSSLSNSALFGHNSSDSLDGNWGSVSALSETKQYQSSPLQTDANNQKEDTRNKEIVAKVTNWGSGKKRTPLKTLLGEDTERSGAESDDSIPVTKNGVSVKKENDVLGTEIEKEWTSPEKYPVNIKTEKRKTKYWANFLCCHSSVNADR